MENEMRGQFTFYASIFVSARRIRNKAARADFYDAICNYALNGTEPDLDKLSDAAAIGFISAKPNLDASRKKAESGKAGGSKKQTASKPQANRKQTGSEKENEVEKEKEVEIEGEKDKEQTESAAPFSGKPFTAFWEAYPSKIDRESAWEAWKALTPSPDTVRQIMTALEAWKRSSQWTEDGGRYIPNAAKFLSKGYWKNIPLLAGKKEIPKGASGELGEAELEAIRQVLAEPQKEG